MATFSSELKRALNEAGLNQKELSERTGISQRMISDYMHGTIPTPERRKILERELNLDPLETSVPRKRYPLEEAANKLGMTVESLKIGLINNLFHPQIGVAIQHDKSYTYTIFENRVEKYIKGEDF